MAVYRGPRGEAGCQPIFRGQEPDRSVRPEDEDAILGSYRSLRIPTKEEFEKAMKEWLDRGLSHEGNA